MTHQIPPAPADRRQLPPQPERSARSAHSTPSATGPSAPVSAGSQLRGCDLPAPSGWTPRRTMRVVVGAFMALCVIASLANCASGDDKTTAARKLTPTASVAPGATATSAAPQAAAKAAAAHAAAVKAAVAHAAAVKAAAAKVVAAKAAAVRAAVDRAAVARAAAAKAAAAKAAAPSAPSTPVCTPGYSPCISPGSDVDCAGGSGNGPRYVSGPVTVTGDDPYGLDKDHNGVGCES
jgi:hypothetical protein